MSSMMPPPGSSWGDLVAEVDVPPVWAERIVFAKGGRGNSWTFWLSAQAWRTRRMDVTLTCKDVDLWEQQTQIFKELAWEVTRCLDWGLNTRVEGKVDYDEETCIRKIIIQVGDGRQLEGPINLIARFKERWS